MQKLNVEDVGCANPQDGDIIVYNFGKAVAHVAIFSDGFIFHSVSGVGVSRASWTDPMWQRRRVTGFRVLV